MLSDIFSAGVILFYMLTRKYPFKYNKISIMNKSYQEKKDILKK
jgi:serine/threonine protein kinase